MKTTDLTGAALDWAVAKCDGNYNFDATGLPWDVDASDPTDEEAGTVWFKPSTNWAQGGPIIEKSLSVLAPDPQHGWIARSYMDAKFYTGQTPLIAAMRCYVASNLGDEVDIPEELR